jgi:FkbM family methyltransferase
MLTTHSASTAQRLDRIFAAIEAESEQERLNRWRGRLDRTVGHVPSRLVLFGAGEMGQWILGRLRRAGLEPLCFADNNPARWGTKVLGIQVLSPSNAVEKFGSNAAFFVTIYNGSSARQQLRQSGCRLVLSAALLFWKYPEEFMPELGIDAPERILSQAAEIRQCFSLLADDASRKELCDQIEWRYWMTPEYLPLPTNNHELYFPFELITENPQEVLVDCGAFDGDSIRGFLRTDRSFQHLYALEPDAANVLRLQSFLSTLPAHLRNKITLLPYAAAEINGQLNFIESHDVTSKVTATGEGTVIESRRLDSLPWEFPPSYIKMDIEGSEPLAIAGAAGLLKASMPVLAVCLYHRSEHLWQIPNLIHALAPQYSLHLRRYAEDCWEQVCYAIPQTRRWSP